MRKAEAAKKIAALQREVSALKAHIARLTAPHVVAPIAQPSIAQPIMTGYAEKVAPVPKPREQTAIPSPVKRPVGRPKGKAKPAQKAKTSAQTKPSSKEKPAKEADSEANIYAVAGVANPLAALSLAQIAKEYGSSGYDDLETPIEDHDRNWASHPRNKTGKWTPGD